MGGIADRVAIKTNCLQTIIITLIVIYSIAIITFFPFFDLTIATDGWITTVAIFFFNWCGIVLDTARTDTARASFPTRTVLIKIAGVVNGFADDAFARLQFAGGND